MEQIKVGDYVRTKDGIIAKITDIIKDLSIDCDRGVFDLGNMLMMEIPWNFKDEYIIKSRPNIIDLIEPGDYVNGKIVEWIGDNFVAFGKLDYAYKEDIKSIVTKEQFERMEYKINENN